MRRFAAVLPRLRRVVNSDLKREDMPRERAIACAVRLLDIGFFRIGGEEYADKNESYGLATLRRDHVTTSNGHLVFDFPAKSGIRRLQTIADADVKAAIKLMRSRTNGPGQEELLAYQEDGEWRDIRSGDINDYLHEHAGEEFSAKTFRTWHATVLAAIELAREASAGHRGKRAIRAAIGRVAEQLGNTPAVCRGSYIDTRVLDRFREGVTIELPKLNGSTSFGPRQQHTIERRVLDLIS